MEPWVVLDPRQRALCRDVMQESHETLMALESSVPKPDLLSYLDCEEEVTALDLHVSRDTPAAEHGAGAGQEEPAEEKPSTDKEHAQLPASQGETCSECGKIFSHKSALLKHRKIHSGDLGAGKPFECSECGKAFAWSSHLQRHMRAHVTAITAGDEEGVQAAPQPPPAPQECADCGRSLNHRTDPRHSKHKAMQTPLAGTNSCEQCGKCFSSSSGLLRHQRVRGSERLHPCPQCPRRFRCSTALAKHQRSHVRPPGDGGHARPATEGAAKPYPCGACGKSFGWLSHLERHRRVHTGEKPFRCGECGRGFAVRSHLERHRRVHDARRFAASSTLLAHRRTHGAQPGRPHACPECGKGFGSPAGLERHWRLHRGEKPFQCGLCGKGFSWSSHYERHRLTHTGEKPLPCAHCGKRFGHSSRCNRQQRTHAQRGPERRPDCGKAFGLGAARSLLSLLPAREGTGTSPELWPEEPSSAEGDSLQGNATAPTEPWVSLPPPSS